MTSRFFQQERSEAAAPAERQRHYEPPLPLEAADDATHPILGDLQELRGCPPRGELRQHRLSVDGPSGPALASPALPFSAPLCKAPARSLGPETPPVRLASATSSAAQPSPRARRGEPSGRGGPGTSDPSGRTFRRRRGPRGRGPTRRGGARGRSGSSSRASWFSTREMEPEAANCTSARALFTTTRKRRPFLRRALRRGMTAP